MRFSAKDESAVERAATAAGERLRDGDGAKDVVVLGPAPQALARLRGQHRWHLMLKGTSARTLHDAAAAARVAHEATKAARQVRMIVDVDPVDVL